jgi:hypothetical protein
MPKQRNVPVEVLEAEAFEKAVQKLESDFPGAIKRIQNGDEAYEKALENFKAQFPDAIERIKRGDVKVVTKFIKTTSVEVKCY